MGNFASLFCAGSQADVTWSNRSPCTDIRRIAVQYRLHGAPQPSARVPQFTPLPTTHTQYTCILHASFVIISHFIVPIFANINTIFYILVLMR